MPFPAKTSAEAILTEATKIVESEGWAALSMRDLARKLGVQASSLYHHFADREAIGKALGKRASQALLEKIAQTSAGKTGAEKIRAIAASYLEFARGNSALYPLVTRSQESLLPGNTGFNVSLFSFLHGYASLEAAGKFSPTDFEAGLEALIAGLQSKENIL